jgi:hypothetical protein
MADIQTYGDLKKIIKAITNKQKVSAIGGGIKGKATDIALDAAIEALKATIPGVGLFKHGIDIFKGILKKPDTRKTNTWLDKLDIDDEMSAIVDDTVENGFIEAMTKTIEAEPDDKALEPDFNMNAKMVNYLKQQYQGRTVAGITENKKMDLQEYIKSLVRELLDEESTSGGAGGYLTPNAFSPKGQKTNAATAQAMRSGFKKAPGIPKNSKVFDYKELWKGKKSAMNETLLDIIEKELINEVTYGKFKKDVKHRTKSEQLHKAIREVKKKLAEIDRIVEYTSRMKQELSEDGGINYWKATQKNVASISEMVNQLNNKIKSLNQ